MSTWLYLECLSHDPPLRAEDESGQHLYDLSAIQADFANRKAMVFAFDHGAPPTDRFSRNTIAFLSQHPHCRVGVRDEYGRQHPLTEDEDPDRTTDLTGEPT